MAKEKNVSDERVGAMSKVDRYQWRKLGAPGALRQIPKRELRIDHEYQRNANENKILAIASDFMWEAFGVASVARRRDGTLWVFDAQHRVLATWRRDDISELPCIVYDVDEVSEEARLFIQANTLRKPLTSVDKHKAYVKAGDRVARVVDDLAHIAQRRIGSDSSPTSIRCVTLLRLWIERDEALVRKMWPLIIRICAEKTMPERVVDALLYIEARISPGRTLTESMLSRRLVSRTADGLKLDADEASAAFKKGGASVWAVGILRMLNAGLRKNRLSVPGLSVPGEES